MHKVLVISLFLVGASLSAQVGIGTTNPQATLDIFTLDPSNPAETDGILIPRVDEFPTTNPGVNQDGMLLFITGSGSIEKGLYFWDNSIPNWVSFLTASAERINDLFDGKSDPAGSSIFIGIDAGTNDDENDNRNIGIGYRSLQANETSLNNIAIGWNSLNASESGGNNTVVGESALRYADTSLDNVAVGKDAMRNAGNSISRSVAVGVEALSEAVSNASVAVGYHALRNTTTGGRNSALGTEANFRNTSGEDNAVIGYRAMRQNLTGSGNVVLGVNSMRESLDGSQNVSIGLNAMRLIESGDENVVIGRGALAHMINGNEIVAVGSGALQWATDQSSKLAIGYRALGSNETSSENTAVGYMALTSLVSGVGENTAIGERALESTISGRQNVAIGWRAMADTGPDTRRSTAIGYQAMRASVGGAGTAVGIESMRYTTTGTENAALGNRSMYLNTTGDRNTAVGHQVLFNNTTANRNTAMGYQTLGTNTTGQHNTAFGYQALGNNETGEENVAIGYHAGRNSTGSRNVFLGREAGRGFEDDLTAIDGNVFIGDRAGYFETNSNRLYIENSDADRENALIYGEFDNELLRVNGQMGIMRAPLTNALEVNGEASKTTAGAFIGNSDRRLKKNIQTLDGKNALDFISKMNGVTYEWNDEVTGNNRPEGMQFGFIAQDLKQLFPEKVTQDALGYYQTAYGDYDPLFVQAIKELKEENEELKIKLEKLIKLEERILTLEKNQIK